MKKNIIDTLIPAVSLEVEEYFEAYKSYEPALYEQYGRYWQNLIQIQRNQQPVHKGKKQS